jgi:hypothetical protein
MKVRVVFTVEVDDRFRRALRLSHNDTGLASRNEVKQWFRMNGDDYILAGELIDDNLEPLDFMDEHGLVNPHGGGLTEEEYSEACQALSEKRTDVNLKAMEADSKRIEASLKKEVR